MARFSFSDWLNAKSARSLFSRRASRRVRRPPGRRFLRLEALERRTLLSACPFMVSNLNDAGPGSLRAAILGANRNGGTDQICFANDLHGTIKLTSGGLAISAENLTIDGPGENRLTVSGNNAWQVFDIGAGATVKIDNLTIADGLTVGGNGGGILNEAGATLNLDQVVLANNCAYADSSGNNGNGGGIENAGSLTIVDSTFTKNLASGGEFTNPDSGCGGGAIDTGTAGSSLTVISSTFTNNQAAGLSTGAGEGNGGAINNNGSTATVTDCTFDGNTASGRTANGGAIATGESGAASPTAISNSTFSGNQAVGGNGASDATVENGGGALGGAILNGASTMTITNSLITGNLAKGGDHGDNTPADNATDGGGFVGFVWGGGVINIFGSLTVTDSFVIGNEALGGNSAAGVGGSALGGGIMLFAASNSLTNVMFVGNQVMGGSGGPGYAGGSAFGGGFYNGAELVRRGLGRLFRQ